MSDDAQQDVLGQKAQAAQRAFEARGMSPAKALRRSLSRTADVNWDLALVTQNVNIETLDQDGVTENLDPTHLLILIDGPDGAVGLVTVDREVLTAIVEVQTIQQVTQMPIDEERVLTPTDAAMMAPLIDGTMELFVANLGDHPLVYQIEGYRFGAMLEDARSAALLLEASSYRAFRAEVDMALGRRHGMMSIILPERAKPRPKPGGAGVQAGPGPHEEIFSRVPAQLDAVLARLSLPLNKAQALKPGDLVPLPHDSLDRVELAAGRGPAVVVGRLGQLNGMRAIRLNLPPAPGAQDPAVGEGGDRGAMGASDAGFDAPPAEELPALDGGLDGGMDFGAEAGGMMDLAEMEAAPVEEELPTLDFAAEVGDFDFDLGENPDGDGADALPDIGDAGEGFASAPVEFDFEEQ